VINEKNCNDILCFIPKCPHYTKFVTYPLEVEMNVRIQLEELFKSPASLTENE
jgi:hypothetical protein